MVEKGDVFGDTFPPQRHVPPTDTQDAFVGHRIIGDVCLRTAPGTRYTHTWLAMKGGFPQRIMYMVAPSAHTSASWPEYPSP